MANKTPKFVSDLMNEYAPHVKPISPLDQQDIESAKTIYIFNTYVTRHTIRMGNLGEVFLAGVDTKKSTNPDEWEPYCLSFQCKDRIISYDKEKQGSGILYEKLDGWLFVKDLLKSASRDRNVNLEYWGVFASSNESPTQKELAAAKEKLVQNLSQIIQEADGFWRGSLQDQGRINKRHRDACNYLKMDREWNIRPEYFVSCTWCSQKISPSALICTNCKNIVNQEAYAKKLAQQEAAIAKAKKAA